MSAKRLYLGLTLIAIIGIPAGAWAEDDYGRSGFFVGAGLGLGWERFEDEGTVMGQGEDLGEFLTLEVEDVSYALAQRDFASRVAPFPQCGIFNTGEDSVDAVE